VGTGNIFNGARIDGNRIKRNPGGTDIIGSLAFKRIIEPVLMPGRFI
jgi:hypothetical protein